MLSGISGMTQATYRIIAAGSGVKVEIARPSAIISGCGWLRIGGRRQIRDRGRQAHHGCRRPPEAHQSSTFAEGLTHWLSIPTPQAAPSHSRDADRRYPERAGLATAARCLTARHLVLIRRNGRIGSYAPATCAAGQQLLSCAEPMSHSKRQHDICVLAAIRSDGQCWRREPMGVSVVVRLP